MKITLFDIGCLTEGDIDISRLGDFGELTVYDITPPEDTLALIGDSECVLVNKTKMTRDIILGAKNLKFIGVLATGVNNIDLAAAHERGIIVSNIPNYSTGAVADLAVSFILQFATNLIKYASSTERGDWQKCKRFTYFSYTMMELEGKTLGIFGMGAIGQRVASICSAMGMKVIYHSRSKKEVPYSFVSLEELFYKSDFISLHAPLTDDTAELINDKSISLMKNTAYIINTARGGLVNEEAVVKALREKRIKGYAADVLTSEPQRKDSPFAGMKDVILTPHIAWAALETRQRLFDILCENIEAYINGNPINTV